MARVNLRYVYATAPDIPAMRRFYVEGLGMVARSFRDGPDDAWLSLATDGFELVFRRGERPAAGASWAVEVPPALYADTIARLHEAGAPATTTEPTWRPKGHWGFTVEDPAGNTIEVYTTPDPKPEGTPDWSRWSGS